MVNYRSIRAETETETKRSIKTHSGCVDEIGVPSVVGYPDILQTVLLLGYLTKNMANHKQKRGEIELGWRMLLISPIFGCSNEAGHVCVLCEGGVEGSGMVVSQE